MKNIGLPVIGILLLTVLLIAMITWFGGGSKKVELDSSSQASNSSETNSSGGGLKAPSAKIEGVGGPEILDDGVAEAGKDLDSMMLQAQMSGNAGDLSEEELKEALGETIPVKEFPLVDSFEPDENGEIPPARRLTEEERAEAVADLEKSLQYNP